MKTLDAAIERLATINALAIKDEPMGGYGKGLGIDAVARTLSVVYVVSYKSAYIQLNKAFIKATIN